MSALEEFIAGARFLIIDDELANVRLLEGNLEEDGQTNFRSTLDSREALALFQDYQPDLVLLDLMMPHLDGFAVMEQLRGVIPPDANLPIVVLTADASTETKERALAAGARDFLTKPFDAVELRLRVRNLLEMRFLHSGLREQNRALESRVLDRTLSLEQALKELHATQKQAIEQERLHAFSEMAGGVVHDFNNSLMILRGFTEMLLGEGALDDRATTLESLGIMATAAEDATHIVGRLRHFYRPRHEDDVFLPVDLRALVEQAAELSKPKWREQALAGGRTIDLQLELRRVPMTLCNASELREVIVNLIFNAVDAMPEGGTLTLAARPEGERVVVEVRDTGTGMSEEVRQRCLEPFYSTKGAAGTGLGLAMVFGIVRRHEGTLDIESAVGAGTTFRISLPVESGAAITAAAAPRKLARSLRVLVAEDDANIRDMIAAYLEAVGHSVTTAGDGVEALAKLGEGCFDLLLTDLSMPRLSGAQLAAAVKKMTSEMPVIMLTGFDAMLLPGGEKPAGVDLLLSKPITADALGQAIATVL